MIFLKSLTFIVWNVILGCILLFMLKWLLFNRKARYIFGIRIPLTPGFLVAKRDWLFDKVRDLVQDYLDQAANPYYKDGYLSKWIKQIRHFIWDKTDFVDGWVFIPVKFK